MEARYREVPTTTGPVGATKADERAGVAVEGRVWLPAQAVCACLYEKNRRDLRAATVLLGSSLLLKSRKLNRLVQRRRRIAPINARAPAPISASEAGSGTFCTDRSSMRVNPSKGSTVLLENPLPM